MDARGLAADPVPRPRSPDFSADGRYLLISTEYAGVVVKVGLHPPKVLAAGYVGGSAVDVKLAPNGHVFYVANQARGGVSVIDPPPCEK